MSTSTPSHQAVTLANRVSMPLLGLGTYRLRADDVQPVVRAAVQAGYRLIDSAAVYRNEAHIGKVIHELLSDDSLGLRREDLFITSKLGKY
ncbi:glyoxal reductase domain protein [Jimgerdemannia flammicorona]|uniref:Glyoxal reductase domain protein n=1 Tax=Jimgerdemannia flammicorona TaxID=994334 RepID=A0A433D3F5_9FUNG|nr:glyoxal reductase domain protein [Jimgerdemannia flammicorona]